MRPKLSHLQNTKALVKESLTNIVVCQYPHPIGDSVINRIQNSIGDAVRHDWLLHR